MAQTGKNIVVAYKVEATLDTAPGASGAEALRITPGAGLGLRKEGIRSQEVRKDGLTPIVRHGSRFVDGSYPLELSLQSFDTILEALTRSTFTTLVVTEATASLASITFGTNTVVATNTSTGSGFLEAGVRVGDIFRITGTAGGSGANNNINGRVQAVATHTVTVLGTSVFTATTTADTSFTMTRGKKVVNVSGGPFTRRSFYIDEYMQDLDLSESFGGCRWTSFRLRGTPNGMAEAEVGVMGMSLTVNASGSSPYFTSPTEYTTDPLVFADANIAYNGTDIAVATAFDMEYVINAAPLPVIGNTTTPDIFDNEARLTGSITMLREDLARLSNYVDEDELELHIMLHEPGSAPQAYLGFFVPKIKLMEVSAGLGGDGALTETLRFEAGLKESATGYDQTLWGVYTSNGA